MKGVKRVVMPKKKKKMQVGKQGDCKKKKKIRKHMLKRKQKVEKQGECN